MPLSQMTYSLTRFAIYETVRDRMSKDSQGPLPFYSKVLLGGFSGECQVGGAGPGPGVGARGIFTCWLWHLCHPRFNWRLCWDPCRLGQCQVCVYPLSPTVMGFPIPKQAEDLPRLLAGVSSMISLEKATRALEPWTWRVDSPGSQQSEFTTALGSLRDLCVQHVHFTCFSDSGCRTT
jgi:hypothetical protein